jgi:hypothetical protein
VPRGQRDGSLEPYSRFSRLEPLLFLASTSSIVLTRLSGPDIYIKEFCMGQIYDCHYIISGYHSNKLSQMHKRYFVSLYLAYSVSIYYILM